MEHYGTYFQLGEMARESIIDDDQRQKLTGVASTRSEDPPPQNRQRMAAVWRFTLSQGFRVVNPSIRTSTNHPPARISPVYTRRA